MAKWTSQQKAIYILGVLGADNVLEILEEVCVMGVDNAKVSLGIENNVKTENANSVIPIFKMLNAN